MDDNSIRIYDSTVSQQNLSRALIEHDVEIEEISKNKFIRGLFLKANQWRRCSCLI